MRLRLALCRALLRLYPRDFRERFGAAMEQAFGERPSAAALLDLAVNAVLVRVPARRSPLGRPALATDLRYAVRTFVRAPMFTTVAVAALTLGIGANTAIFTIVNSLLLRPLPYADARRLVMVWSSNALEHRGHDAVAPLDFLDYRAAAAFADLQATYSFIVGTSLNLPAGAEQITVTAVTPGMFEMLGRQPAMGRLFTAGETTSAVVVSDGFWRRRLGRDPAVIGRVLSVDNQPRTIVGVMPADFTFPYKTMLGPSGFSRANEVEAWLPLAFVNDNSRATGVASLTRGVRFLSVVGRLKPDATVEQADAEVRGIAAQLAAAYPGTNRMFGATVVALHEQAVGTLRPALTLLLAGVGFVLLMACVNLANMLLARSAARQREIAIRTALGASRARLVGQMLLEALLLSATGGACAFAVVSWGIRALVALAPGDMPRLGEIHPDAVVLAFTIALSLVTGLSIGLVPAAIAARPIVQTSLKDGGRGMTASRGQRRLRAALVVAELALAMVLTAGAGLLLRSFLSVLAIDPGFNPDRLLTMQIALPSAYRTADQQRAVYGELFSRLESLPGVVAAGGTTRLPLGSTNVSTKVEVEGRPLPPGERPEVEFRRAVRNYFAAMGIPVLRGRGFSDQDGPASPPVAIVNGRMAQRLWPGDDPVGKRIRIGNGSGPWITVVGVIGDVRHSALEAEPEAELYIWYLQGPPVNPFLVVRTAGDSASLAAAVRAAVQGVDRNIAAYDIRPMAQVLAESVAQRRFVLLLVGAFGALALVMAAVGVYGVMALTVSERTAEIGIRLALGATPWAVLRSVVGEAFGLAAAGIVAGLLAARGVMPLLSSQLYGVRPIDPATTAGVPLLLLAIALLACLVPARRAMTIDPVNALRE